MKTLRQNEHYYDVFLPLEDLLGQKERLQSLESRRDSVKEELIIKIKNLI